MKKLIAAAIASIAFLTAGSPVFAESHMDKKMSNMKMNGMKAFHSCPRGKVWVNGYKTKHGKSVNGYCRIAHH